MIMYNLRVRAQPGRREELLALFRELADAAAAEPGMLLYTFSTVDADADLVVTFELFRDAAAVEAHTAGTVMQSLRPRLGPLIADTEMLLGEVAFGKGLPAS